MLKRNIAGSREGILEMRRESVRVARDMAYKGTAMLELGRERPVLLSVDEFDRFNRQIHRYAALVEDVEEYAEQCQFLLEEPRAQVEEETNRNHYILTTFSVIFLPATPIASIWGMYVGGIPQPERILGVRRADSGALRFGRGRPFPVPAQALLRGRSIRARLRMLFSTL